MDKQKVFETLESLNITIGRPSSATKIFEFRNEEGERPRFEVDEIIADNTSYDEGVVVTVDFSETHSSNADHVCEEYDWDEDHQIEDFIKLLKGHSELNEAEVRFLFKFCELHLPEAKLMKVFNYPTEAFLTHTDELVRQEGLIKVGDKTD